MEKQIEELKHLYNQIQSVVETNFGGRELDDNIRSHEDEDNNWSSFDSVDVEEEEVLRTVH